MWLAINETPYAAERTLTTDLEGRDTWLVVVKGTFLIQPDGSTELAPKQVPVYQDIEHRGDTELTSLLYETDMVLGKPNTDLLLEGHGHAPHGVETDRLDVRLQVGSIKKAARVWGDRVWKRGRMGRLKLTDPLPFLKMPLLWERAYGGTDKRGPDPESHDWEPRNPVGAGFAVEADHLEGRAAPNVEDLADLISSWKHRPRPVGFGPVARHWLPRRAFAGTYDEDWEKHRFPLLPTDFDERFNQLATEDQQASGHLRGGEAAELINLTPSGILRFTLPKIALRFETRIGSESIESRPALHTVILEPDVPRVLMVWQTSVPCHGRKLKIRWTRITEKKYVEL